MSHYSVAVITYTDSISEVEELLEPFDENIEVEPYIDQTKEELIADARKRKQRWIEEFRTYNAAELMDVLVNSDFKYARSLLSCETDEEFFDHVKDLYFEDDFDEEGNLLSSYNPKAAWDWYSIGGRWSCELYDKTIDCWCDTVKFSDWDMDYEDAQHYKFSHTYAVITPDGEWHAPGKMGWFGCSSETSEEMNDWANKYKDEMRKADPDWYITIVDCHI